MFDHTRRMREGRLHMQTSRELEEDKRHDSADSDWHSYSDESLDSRANTGEPKHRLRARRQLPRKRHVRRKKGIKEQSDRI